MAGLFRKQHKLVPVSFADGLTLMFSENDWERAFMIHMWELLKIYSVEDLESPKTDLMEVPGIPDRYQESRIDSSLIPPLTILYATLIEEDLYRFKCSRI